MAFTMPRAEVKEREMFITLLISATRTAPHFSGFGSCQWSSSEIEGERR